MILGIGVDLCRIERIAALLARRPRFTDKVLLPAEAALCLSRGEPARHIAGRFAAKEAVMKALGSGWGKGVGFREIEVVPGADDGPPSIRLTGEAARRAGNGTRIHISISHDAGAAVAFAVWERG
jgi:holo-[acyl-carrier protein] synthase